MRGSESLLFKKIIITIIKNLIEHNKLAHADIGQ